MPPPPRIQLDKVPLHIVQRGHNREPCFFGEKTTRPTFTGWARRSKRTMRAACLRPHDQPVHRLITPERSDAVPRLSLALGRRYVQYINTAYRRTGTLWDSRYKSSLIRAETYLLACQRYIELNPVRAAMVDDPAHYR